MTKKTYAGSRKKRLIFRILTWTGLMITLATAAVCASAEARPTSRLGVQFVAAPASAATAPSGLYVDGASVGGRCSDARSAAQNSVTTPWCSIGRAFAAAPAGSIVSIRAGQYPVVNVAAYAPSAMVTFTAYPGEQPLIQGMNIGGPGAASSNFALVGLKFTNPGLNLTNLSHVQLTGNEFAMVPQPATACTGGPPRTAHCTAGTPDAVLLTPPASNLTIDDNYFHDGSMGVAMRNGNPPVSPGHPISTTFQHIAIDGNTFSRMGDVVIQIQAFEGVDISDNTFANDQMRADVDPECHCDAVHAILGGDALMLNRNLTYGGRGFLIQPGYPSGQNCIPRCLTITNAVVQNNVFLGHDFGLRVFSAPGIKVLNNTIEGPAGQDLGLSFVQSIPATTGAVVANNLISYFASRSSVTFAAEDYNGVGQRGTGVYSAPTGPHDRSGTPQLVDPQAPDWNAGLAPQSFGVGAGSAAYAPSIDLAGWQSRSPVNMGANGGEQPTSSPGTTQTAFGARAFSATPVATVARSDGGSRIWKVGGVVAQLRGQSITVGTGLAVTCGQLRPCRVRVSVTVLSRQRGRQTRRVRLASVTRTVGLGRTRLLDLHASATALARLVPGRRAAGLRVHISVAGASRSRLVLLSLPGHSRPAADRRPRRHRVR